MPELPEAETIVRGLRPSVTGRSIRKVQVHHLDLLRCDRRRFCSLLEARRIDGVERRGKNVVFCLEDRWRLVVNLGMTGRLLLAAPGIGGETRHPGVTLLLDDGGRLVYDDVRRFGSLDVLDRTGFRAWSRRLGPEPLSGSFTARRLREGLGHSRTPIRSWLLDQRNIAGMGNIYANEALFLARIHPRQPAGSLNEPEARALHRALRRVLRLAVEARGTTLRDYRDPLGRQGSFGPRLAVYGREGESCPRCGGVVTRAVFGNRSAFFCSRCQPEP